MFLPTCVIMFEAGWDTISYNKQSYEIQEGLGVAGTIRERRRLKVNPVSGYRMHQQTTLLDLRSS